MSAADNVKPVNEPHPQVALSTSAPVTTVAAKPLATALGSQAKATAATQAVIVQAPHESVPVKITASPTDYVGPSVAFGGSLVVGFIGWCVVRWQLNRQRVDAQSQHRANTKAQLRLDAYRDFQVALGRLYACDFPDVQIMLIRNQLENAINLSQHGYPIQISARVMDFGKVLNAFMVAINDLTFFIERYESLLPGFDIFKTAFGCAMHDVRKHRPALDAVLVRWLPMDGVDQDGHPITLNQRKIEPVALQEFDSATKPMSTALGQARVWVMDLAIDAQNFLLGDYADKPVSRRQPVDQTYFTVTNDPVARDRLDALFDNTDYARSNAASIAYAHARYATVQDLPTKPP